DPDTALAMIRRAATLDPRSPTATQMLGGGLSIAGRWDEAREALERMLRLAPGDIVITNSLIDVSLAEGDLAGARRRLATAVPAAGRAALLAHVTMFGDNYWVLERAQQDTVLQLGPEYFTDDPASRAYAFAQILHARGDSAGARRWAGEAARGFQRHAAGSEDPQMPALAAMSLAFEGRHAEAAKWFERASADAAGAERGVRRYIHELTARARLLADDEPGAMAALEKFLQDGRRTEPGRLSIHPEFARLRGNPRFDQLARPDRAPSCAHFPRLSPTATRSSASSAGAAWPSCTSRGTCAMRALSPSRS